MVFFCKELNKEFETQTELFEALKSHEQDILALKKANIFKSIDKNPFGLKFISPSHAGITDSEKAALKTEDGYIYAVISTTNYLDSHGDVHFKGCFNQTVKNQQGSVYYITDHLLSFNNIIAYPKDIEMIVADIPWGLVGKDYNGTTNALIFKIAEENVRKDVLEAIKENKASFENSIRMRYIKARLALNSSAKEDAAYKAYWDSKINEIANKEDAEKQGYFFGVEELSIYKEGSLVIGGGSNDATSVIVPKKIEENKTEAIESTDADHSERVVKTYIHNLI